MTKHFFITSHQRCRTAWIANLFCDGNEMFCHHDATRMMPRPPHLEDIVTGELPGIRFEGDSDNGLPLFPKALDYYYARQPDLPIVIVRRDPADVRRSLRRLHYGRVTEDQIERSIGITEEGLAEIAKGPNVLEVAYDDLNSMNTLTEMSIHLTGNVFDLMRAAYLRGWNVQMQEPLYSAGFSEQFTNIVKQKIGGP